MFHWARSGWGLVAATFLLTLVPVLLPFLSAYWTVPATAAAFFTFYVLMRARGVYRSWWKWAPPARGVWLHFRLGAVSGALPVALAWLGAVVVGSAAYGGFSAGSGDPLESFLRWLLAALLQPLFLAFLLEVPFRGLILDGLQERVPPRAAAAIGAVLYAAWHLPGLWRAPAGQVAVTLATALLLGWAFSWLRSRLTIWVPIGWQWGIGFGRALIGDAPAAFRVTGGGALVDLGVLVLFALVLLGWMYLSRGRGRRRIVH